MISFVILGAFFIVLFSILPWISRALGIERPMDDYYLASSIALLITYGGIQVFEKMEKILSALEKIQGEKEKQETKGQGG